MDNKLEKTMELSREPMLMLEHGRLQYLNAAARLLFRDAVPGAYPDGIIPEELLAEAPDSVLSSVTVQNRLYTVSGLRDGDTLLLAFSPDDTAEERRGLLSDSLMSGMLSSLFNLALAADRITARLDEENPEMQKYAAMLRHNFYALNRRLSNLNYLCADSDNCVQAVLRYADLTALCRDIADAVNTLLGPESPQVEFCAPAEAITACVDTQKIERLILNLLVNSLQHTAGSGIVRLRLSRRAGSAVLSVDDNGCGIPPERLSSVFCAYRNRLDESSLSDPGTGGLGLSVCRSIAEKHGGTLILESRPGEGTSVRVLLPLTPPGCDQMRTDLPEYENGGMSILLTELSDLLGTEAYGPRFSD